jgi:integrase
MAAKLEKTKTPGIFKRGSRYVFSYRQDGRQRWESARTFDEARNARSERLTDVRRGEHSERSTLKLRDYAPDWIGRYQGTGRRGFSEETRREYRRDFERYLIPQLGHRRLAEITPQHVAGLIAWLCDEDKQRARAVAERRKRTGEDLQTATRKLKSGDYRLGDATVRRILAPLRSCLRTAMRDGLIRQNPTQGAALPVRDEHRRIAAGVDDLGDDQDVKALSSEQLLALLLVAPARHRLLFETLAATGLRISEALALRWGDLALDGERPVVRVRRAYVRGTFKAPKSRYGRREVPIDHNLVRAFRAGGPGEGRALVFPGDDGGPLHASNLLVRMFKPAAEEAGVPWAGFHTLRHTCATMLFAEGRNAVQVQRWLGHHSPAFTLATYVHLLDEDVGEPLSIARRERERANRVQTCPTPLDATMVRPVSENLAA